MTEVEALVTAAIRYCSTNHAYWAQQYTERRTGSTYSDSDYDLFPRYNVLQAIQENVEYYVGQKTGSIVEVKEQLIAVGSNAQTPFTSDAVNLIASTAMREERSKFITYINGLTGPDLHQVEALPYRRRLSDEERNTIRNNLDVKWAFKGGYWVPLVEVEQATVFLAFDSLTDQDRSTIEQFIRGVAQGRLLELTEFGPDYEIDLALFDIDLYETLVCDRTMEWVVYGSHESTLAFGGAALIDLVERLFVTRHDMLNRWPDYLRPAMK